MAREVVASSIDGWSDGTPFAFGRREIESGPGAIVVVRLPTVRRSCAGDDCRYAASIFIVAWWVGCETSFLIVFALFSVLLKWLRYSFGVVFKRREKIMRMWVEFRKPQLNAMVFSGASVSSSIFRA